MLGREKLETFTSCELYDAKTDTFKVGEVLLKDEVDKVMDAMERRIARLFNLVAGYQRNSLGLSAMYNRRLDSELERIAELESQLPKWISVKDRLPEELDKVIVYDDGSIYVAELDDYEDDKIWVTCWFSSSIEETYWMPLPRHPQPRRINK